jgi:hypothetical protein
MHSATPLWGHSSYVGVRLHPTAVIALMGTQHLRSYEPHHPKEQGVAAATQRGMRDG